MFDTRVENINQLWANMIVEELIRNDVKQFALSPGSRCSPLTVAATRHQRANVVSHFDERGAAFYALGYARATGKPAALVCTSGTATANYYPAVIEASMDMVPMVVLTADRPAELRDTGANQTIDQVDLYGKYPRFFHDLPSPDENTSAESVLTIINEAVDLGTRSPRGPVHVNCQFVEPLAPTGPTTEFREYLMGLMRWLNDDRPFIVRKQKRNQVSARVAQSVSSIINEAESGLVVVGALGNDTDIQAVKELAGTLNWPVFADIRSGLRLGSDSGVVVNQFDQLLLSKKYNDLGTEVILHFGSVMTSKRFNEYTQKCGCKHYVHIADHPMRHDPNSVVTERITADIANFCFSVQPLIKPGTDSHLLEMTKDDDRNTGNIIESAVDDGAMLTEIAVARLVSKYIGRDSCLFLGSSMPLRDMDMYADANGASVKVAANRGASGIDGSIATAVGWANGNDKVATAVIGDLAFLHDVNSLVLLKNSENPVTLVVINNDGGGIFSFLPVYGCKDVFEKYFGTPHGMSFEKMADAFGIDYFRPGSTESFVRDFQKAQTGGKSSIIEVVTDREDNRVVHLDLQEKIRAAIDGGGA